MKRTIWLAFSLILSIYLSSIALASETEDFVCYTLTNAVTGSKSAITMTISTQVLACGANPSHCKIKLLKLNFETGEFESFMDTPYPCHWIDIAYNRCFGESWERGFGSTGVKAVDLNTKKVTALPFTQSGEPEHISLRASPDGSRIWAMWNEGAAASAVSYTGVFDGNTYKLIKKDGIIWPGFFLRMEGIIILLV
jgi:hypothetical protein